MVDVEDILLKILYGWTVATNSSHFSNFLELLDLCYLSSP